VAELQQFAASPNLFERETYLLAISELLQYFPVNYQSNYVFQPMIRMLSDPSHNVVMLALGLLSKHREALHPFQRQYEVVPILTSLAESGQSTIVLSATGVAQSIRERAARFLSECQN
jgi:hypothetical protein